mmetsp:Transcript_13046/g.21122  ORF Transcript_13046/g.21122 Transcript_13046/m.21122 type:complete len:624 (-) Transcript_13046:143-2014(-)|eukprot:CAMPEP_0203757364 /NCGR_PEP_ID=MMETSP0098-20131031/10465_1 /ASSEMBLY_ACC=CAM_ASM_000208 /TAXON_ID=96639 /ORGANISM=" , Strain NY0313808BC1" /LENGTH=623 /DNA_ID=CAMNT_0050649573 /DNA_START=273 /DNA_END=2144 /DNA_ORIENTATION=-
MKVFIFGVGYVGSRLANQLVDGGHYVGGCVRCVARLRKQDDPTCSLSQAVEVCELPMDDENALEDLIAGYDAWVFTAPVDRGTGLDPFLGHEVVGKVLRRLSDAGEVDWVGYLSTTSVYGDHNGAWVDEETAVAPTLPRGFRRLAVERSFLESGLPVHVFRLPGIYGPGRGPLSRLRGPMARNIFKKGQVFSRIHVDDIVGVLCTSLHQPNPGRVYNVVDDEPAPTHQVTEYASELLGIKCPDRQDYDVIKETLGPMAISFYSENKRVSNKRIKEELGYNLIYPTYREGFPAQLAEELGQGWTIIDPSPKNKKKKVGAVTQDQYQGHSLRLLVTRFLKRFQKVCACLTNWFYNIFVRPILARKKIKTCLLVDNGSIRPEPVLQLRQHAAKLQEALGIKVQAVHARHSNKIEPSRLGGIAASILEHFVGQKNVLVLPFFLGSTTTLTTFIPGLLPGAIIAPPLVGSDGKVADIVVSMIKQVAEEKQLPTPYRVVLVDHGSPSRDVNKTRRGLASQVRRRLGSSMRCVVDCSMERRPGDKYAFNDPLLENVFGSKMGLSGDVILAHAFLAPGRHAGENGDIHDIVSVVQKQNPGLRVHLTGLIGEDQVEICQLLKFRFDQALSSV